MAYREFSFEQVKKQFQLQEKYEPLFLDISPITPNNWLKEYLEMGTKLAFASASEKARSEFIVAPILLELEKINLNAVSIFSGIRLDVDQDSGLKGECDFILSRSPLSYSLKAPILCLVEAKKQDIDYGLGQCVAQMLGAQKFNEINEEPIEKIYGCVTTGEAWQFLKLMGKQIYVDQERYYLSDLDKILGIFQFLIDEPKA